MKQKTALNSFAALIVVLLLTATSAWADPQWLVINEIFNHPDDYNHEFIELYNNGPCVIPLGNIGVTVGDDITLTFPAGAEAQAGEYILCVRDASDPIWDNIKLMGIQIFEYGLSLANTTGTIDIISTSCGATAVNDTVTFDNDAPWPEDGNNGFIEGIHSLELTDPDLDNDDGANWAGSSVDGGTPGVANSVFIPPTL